MMEFFTFFGIIFFAYGTFAGVIYLCDKHNDRNKKKSLCDTCVYCIQKIDCKDRTKYFASIKCPFRYTGDTEVDQHLGIIDYCTSYKRRADDVK